MGSMLGTAGKVASKNDLLRVAIACIAVLVVTGCVYLLGTYVQYRNGSGSGWRKIFDQQRISKAELETLVLGPV